MIPNAVVFTSFSTGLHIREVPVWTAEVRLFCGPRVFTTNHHSESWALVSDVGTNLPQTIEIYTSEMNLQPLKIPAFPLLKQMWVRLSAQKYNRPHSLDKKINTLSIKMLSAEVSKPGF